MARMSSARLEPSPTAPADNAGVVVAVISGVVPAPVSSTAFGSSSSVSAGPPWSVRARAAKKFPALHDAVPRAWSLPYGPSRGSSWSEFPSVAFFPLFRRRFMVC